MDEKERDFVDHNAAGLPQLPTASREWDRGRLDHARALLRWAYRQKRPAGAPSNFYFGRPVINRYLEVGHRPFDSKSSNEALGYLLEYNRAMVQPTDRSRFHRDWGWYVPASPYNHEQLSLLLMWAQEQEDDEKREAAIVLLSLNLGAGLSATEVMHVEARDISEPEGPGGRVAIEVRAGLHPRTLTVGTSAWTRLILLRTQQLLPAERLFDRKHKLGPGLVYNFVDRSRVVGLKPSTRRGRSTWIVHELRTARDPRTVLQSAGLSSLSSLQRLDAFWPMPGTHE